MATGYEREYYANIDGIEASLRSIATSLNRLANCAEANERRHRRWELENDDLEPRHIEDVELPDD